MTLFIDDGYIASREDTLETGSLVTALGPVGIHELGDKDTVVGKDG